MSNLGVHLLKRLESGLALIILNELKQTITYNFKILFDTRHSILRRISSIFESAYSECSS